MRLRRCNNYHIVCLFTLETTKTQRFESTSKMSVSNEEKYPQTETMHYDTLVDKLNRYGAGLENSPNRFVKFSDRKISSCWGVSVMEGLHKGQYKGTWRGLKLLKHATVLQIYQELLQKEKPKTIIEFGTFHSRSISSLVRSMEGALSGA